MSNFDKTEKLNDFKSSFKLERNLIDLRIIAGSPAKTEFLYKSINAHELKEDYSIVISSIIPTDNLEIAVNASKGADILLIANDLDFNDLNNESDSNIASKIDQIKNKLKSEVSYISSFNIPKNIINADLKAVNSELINSIVSAGLSSISNNIDKHKLNEEIKFLNEKYEESIKEKEKLNLEAKFIKDELDLSLNENEALKDEVKYLKENLKVIQENLSQFKSRYSNLHDKNILEIFSLSDIWMEVFNENVLDMNMIVIATNKFKPENIIIGQGFIGAISKNEAIEWLKILRTALLFIDKNDDIYNSHQSYKKFADNQNNNQLNSHSNHNSNPKLNHNLNPKLNHQIDNQHNNHFSLNNDEKNSQYPYSNENNNVYKNLDFDEYYSDDFDHEDLNPNSNSNFNKNYQNQENYNQNDFLDNNSYQNNSPEKNDDDVIFDLFNKDKKDFKKRKNDDADQNDDLDDFPIDFDKFFK